MTDDGSYGEHGFVTVKLQQLLESGIHYDEVLAIGPIPMMKFVSKTTEPFGVKTVVSLNPIMVDGTGMCGGCRVTVGGEVKFACVDGPDFDGHLVDYDELLARNRLHSGAPELLRLVAPALVIRKSDSAVPSVTTQPRETTVS